MTYNELAKIFEENPHDVHTVPKDNRVPLWFYAGAENGVLYAESAHKAAPASRISFRRNLSPKEFNAMLDLYSRRKGGEPVSREATEITRNQVYWYGIFADTGL